MDQVAALHWIEENIQRFGGDPHNVTIFGHDYGAACINFLMISPVAKGLFHRAILMSGSALADWALVREPLAYARQLAAVLNCSSSADTVAASEADRIAICLRATPVKALLDAQLNVPDHVTVFGPSVDGIVIRDEPAKVMRHLTESSGSGGGSGGGGGGGNNDHHQQTQQPHQRHYDLMFGVTSTEGVFPFGQDEFMSGFGPDKKSRVLRTFVRNIYTYHLNEIYSVLNNEYTDWTKPVQHPVNIRDATMEMFGDAQFVAPLVRAGDLYSSAYANVYFYVFEHRTAAGSAASGSGSDIYPPRLGCFHGEEVPYVFGAPFAEDLFHFRGNYTKAEQKISESVMRYWTSFAKTGDPSAAERHNGQSNANRFSKSLWPLYETVQQKYFSIDGRLNVRHHYRAHKMSVWLKLVPDIHRSGGSAVSVQHHMLDNHDDASTYEGLLRPTVLTDDGRQPFAVPTAPTPVPATVPAFSSNNSSLGHHSNKTMLWTTTAHNGGGGAAANGTHQQHHQNGDAKNNGSNPLRVEAIQHGSGGAGGAPGGGGNYTTALSVTIAVGCSLLILNVLIFAGVYYQRDKNRVQAKVNNDQRGGASGSAHLHLQNKENEEMASIGSLGRGLHTIRPMADQLKQPLPPRTPPPSPCIVKGLAAGHLSYCGGPEAPINSNSSSSSGRTLNIPRPMIKAMMGDHGHGQDHMGVSILPESQPLLLQNLRSPQQQQQQQQQQAAMMHKQPNNVQEVRV